MREEGAEFAQEEGAPLGEGLQPNAREEHAVRMHEAEAEPLVELRKEGKGRCSRNFIQSLIDLYSHLTRVVFAGAICSTIA